MSWRFLLLRFFLWVSVLAWGVVLGAKLFDNYDWNTLLAVLAVAFLLAATMWLFIDPRRTFYDRETQ